MKTRQQIFDELNHSHMYSWPDYMRMDDNNKSRLFAWKRSWWCALLNAFPDESGIRQCMQ